MSILKDINVGIVPYEYMFKTHDYLADDLKTENGKYVDGVGFINKNKMMDKFMAVKISNSILDKATGSLNGCLLCFLSDYRCLRLTDCGENTC